MYYSFIKDIKCLNIIKRFSINPVLSVPACGAEALLLRNTACLHLTHGIHHDAPAFGPLKQQGPDSVVPNRE